MNDTQKITQYKLGKIYKDYQTQAQADYDSLPALLRKEIDALRQREGAQGMSSVPYAMFICKESVKIVKALKTPEKIKSFAAISPDKQKQIIANLSNDHTPGTLSLSCAVAIGYINELRKSVSAMNQQFVSEK